MSDILDIMNTLEIIWGRESGWSGVSIYRFGRSVGRSDGRSAILGPFGARVRPLGDPWELLGATLAPLGAPLEPQTSQIARSERVEIAGVQAPAIWDVQNSNASDFFRALTRKNHCFLKIIKILSKVYTIKDPGSKYTRPIWQITPKWVRKSWTPPTYQTRPTFQ